MIVAAPSAAVLLVPDAGSASRGAPPTRPAEASPFAAALAAAATTAGEGVSDASPNAGQAVDSSRPRPADAGTVEPAAADPLLSALVPAPAAPPVAVSGHGSASARAVAPGATSADAAGAVVLAAVAMPAHTPLSQTPGLGSPQEAQQAVDDPAMVETTPSPAATLHVGWAAPTGPAAPAATATDAGAGASPLSAPPRQAFAPAPPGAPDSAMTQGDTSAVAGPTGQTVPASAAGAEDSEGDRAAQPGVPRILESLPTGPGAGIPDLAAPTTAPATPAAGPPPETPRAVAAQIAPTVFALAQRPSGEHRMTLTVHPDSLGAVTVRAHIGQGGEVRVELLGATDAGRDALRTIVAELRRDLAAVNSHASLTLGADGDTGSAGRDSALGRDASDGAGEGSSRPAPSRELGPVAPEPTLRVLGPLVPAPGAGGLDIII